MNMEEKVEGQTNEVPCPATSKSAVAPGQTRTSHIIRKEKTMPSILKLPDDFESMPTSALLNLKIQMENNIDEIKEQLARAKKLPAQPENGFGSPGWVRRAKKSRRAYAQDIQRIQLEMQSRRINDKAGKSRLENLFVTIAHRRLNPVIFNSIMDEAREEIQG